MVLNATGGYVDFKPGRKKNTMQKMGGGMFKQGGRVIGNAMEVLSSKPTPNASTKKSREEKYK